MSYGFGAQVFSGVEKGGIHEVVVISNWAVKFGPFGSILTLNSTGLSLIIWAHLLFLSRCGPTIQILGVWNSNPE